MTANHELVTERLRLRRWLDGDAEPFARFNDDPRVMEFMPSRLDREQSDAMLARIRDHFERHGFGVWAVEVRDSGTLAGYVGLSVPRFAASFTPCVEVGWRLGHEYWGRGYASEAARAALAFGFQQLRLDEILSFTVPANQRSQRVMQRIGMSRAECDDFEHPLLPPGHPLRWHVLYRLTRTQWEASRGAPA